MKRSTFLIDLRESFPVFMIASIPLFLHQNLNAAGITGNDIEEITVLGDSNLLAGKPWSATEGMVFDQQLRLRPLSRPAELLEFIPGLMATQHSGEGKANQYFLRGFNLDHGTDLAISVDGLPVNMPSHAHGQGYADLNFLMPEMVSWMSYRKGPYYADSGDFATAGSSSFVYADRLEHGMLNLTAGEQGYQRLFAGNSFAVGAGDLTTAATVTRYDGPWQLPQALDDRKALLKYHTQTERGAWSLTGMSYENDWTASDQVPLRAVQSGTLDRFGYIDPENGGETHRHSLKFDWQLMTDAASRWDMSGYVIDYGLDLFSNFTYFLDDPVRGDQFQQSDSRRVLGLQGGYRKTLRLAGAPSTLSLGLESRIDDIDLGLYRTQGRAIHSVTREDRVEQSLSSAHLSLEQEWSGRFRTAMALRADHYRYRVDAGLAANSGSGNDTLLSPRLSLIFSPHFHTEYFLSAGQGFHSNDARGTTISVDPASGERVEAVDPLARARSLELGLRSAILPRTQLAVSAFVMTLDSELVYIGDAGGTEALNGSRRTGIEASVVFAPTNWMLLDADLTHTRARLEGAGADSRIPNSVGRTASLGMTLQGTDRWNAGLRLRYLGEAPLNESGEQWSDPTFLVNAQASLRLSQGLTASLELLNLMDSDDRDITYFYESRLSDETEAVEDLHFHPVEPRTLRLSLQLAF